MVPAEVGYGAEPEMAEPFAEAVESDFEVPVEAEVPVYEDEVPVYEEATSEHHPEIGDDGEEVFEALPVFVAEHGDDAGADEHDPERDFADQAHELEDRFAQLRAAIAKAQTDEMPPVGTEDGEVPAHGYAESTEDGEPADMTDEEGGSEDGRSALRALLAEVTAHTDEPPAEEAPVDGLMDRGPWTSHELEQMGAWHEGDGSEMVAGAETPNNVLPFPGPGQESAEVAGEAEDEADPAAGEEPINRGLLLKFLSSVRN
jgi:hypothetical protein